MSAHDNHEREPYDDDDGVPGVCPGRVRSRPPRLLCALEGRSLITPRAQAALAAGLLAVSALGPAPAAIAGGDTPGEHEGQAAPEDPGPPGDSSQSPEFDPGGPQTDLSGEIGPEDPSGDTDAPAPLEVEPETDPGVQPEPTTTPGLPPETPPVPDAEQPPAPEGGTTATPPTTPAPPPEPLASPPVEPAPVEEQDMPAPAKPKDQGHTKREAKGRPRPRHEHPPAAPQSPTTGGQRTEVAVVTEQSSAGASESEPAAADVKPGDRVHVVQRGESLWAIARAVVGPDATISEIAGEVTRLWRLNRERIGTGDPDLILPGTRLKLR